MSKTDLDFDRAQRLYQEALRHGAVAVTPQALRAAAGVPQAAGESTKLTPEEFEKKLEEVRAALGGTPALLNYLKKNEPPFGGAGKAYRWPYPLVAHAVPSGHTVVIHVHTDVVMKPRHMILSENTAECFDLCGMMVGNCAQYANADPLPLETFSVKYYADAKDPERIMNIQEWTHDPVTPAMRLSLYVKSREPAGPTSFRGILWADCVMPC